MGFYQHGSVTFHTPVVVCGQQDHQHSDVAQACSIVLKCVVEGQIDEVVHDKDDGNG